VRSRKARDTCSVFLSWNQVCVRGSSDTSDKIEESRLQQLGVGVGVGVLTWCVTPSYTEAHKLSNFILAKHKRTVNFSEKIWLTMFIEKRCRRKCQYSGHSNFPSPRLYPIETLQTPTYIDTSISYRHILCKFIEWTDIISSKFLISEEWSAPWSQDFPKVFLIHLAPESFQVFYWSDETNRLIITHYASVKMKRHLLEKDDLLNFLYKRKCITNSLMAEPEVWRR
jgi:hypothetical protein